MKCQLRRKPEEYGFCLHITKLLRVVLLFLQFLKKSDHFNNHAEIKSKVSQQGFWIGLLKAMFITCWIQSAKQYFKFQQQHISKQLGLDFTSPVICKEPRLLCLRALKEGLTEALFCHMSYFIPGIAVLTHIKGWVCRIQNKWPEKERSHLYEWQVQQYQHVFTVHLNIILLCPKITLSCFLDSVFTHARPHIFSPSIQLGFPI